MLACSPESGNMMKIDIDCRTAGKIARTAGACYFVFVLAWIVLMLLTNYEGSPEEQFNLVKTDSFWYMLNFINATLISIPIASAYIILALVSDSGMKLRHILGILLLIPYIILVSIAYTSQYTYLPLLLNLNGGTAYEWFFNNPSSVVYFLDQLGYMFFAVSGLLIGFDYVTGRGIQMVIGILMYAVSSFSAAAFILLGMNPVLGGTSSVISGGLTLPLAIAIIIYGNKLIKS